MWLCCWKPVESWKNVQETLLLQNEKMLISSIICVTHFIVWRGTLVSTDALWVKGQRNSVTEAVCPRFISFKDLQNCLIYIQRTYMYLWTKYRYIILIYFEPNAQRQEKTVMSINGRPFCKLFKCISPRVNDRSLTIATCGLRIKGPPSQWKLPIPHMSIVV